MFVLLYNIICPCVLYHNSQVDCNILITKNKNCHDQYWSFSAESKFSLTIQVHEPTKIFIFAPKNISHYGFGNMDYPIFTAKLWPPREVGNSWIVKSHGHRFQKTHRWIAPDIPIVYGQSKIGDRLAYNVLIVLLVHCLITVEFF